MSLYYVVKLEMLINQSRILEYGSVIDDLLQFSC